MIVVDTNVIAYLYLPCEHTAQAEACLRRDPEWVAPRLWRSEFRNILAGYLRRRLLGFDAACALQGEAESQLAGCEYDVDSLQVLRLVRESECSAYDCEFVALAQALGTSLITMDQKLARNFPDVVVKLGSEF